jgi:hypothetical protein
MKSIKYITYLKTVLLIVPASLYFTGATMVHAGDKSRVSVGLISPNHLDYPPESRQGYLKVNSATDRIEDGGLEYYAHSSYTVYTVDGKVFKRVENHLSATDETPEMVSLPIGSYIVEARSEREGYIRRPVTIKEARRTILDLDVK